MSTIEEYEKIIKENANHMHELWVLYNMMEHENYARLNGIEKIKLLHLTIQLWILTEEISLDRMSDIVMENYEDALEGKLTKHDIYKKYL